MTPSGLFGCETDGVPAPSEFDPVHSTPRMRVLREALIELTEVREQAHKQAGNIAKVLDALIAKNERIAELEAELAIYKEALADLQRRANWVGSLGRASINKLCIDVREKVDQ